MRDYSPLHDHVLVMMAVRVNVEDDPRIVDLMDRGIAFHLWVSSDHQRCVDTTMVPDVIARYYDFPATSTPVTANQLCYLVQDPLSHAIIRSH